MPDTLSQNRGRICRLAVIQPHLSNPSREMFLELSTHCAIDLVVSPAPSGTGFEVAPLPESSRVREFNGPTLRPWGKKLGWVQMSVLSYIVSHRPDAVFLNANPRYLTFWLTLLWARVLGIPVYAHGHGFYRRARIGSAYRLMIAAMLKFVTVYICYAPIVRQAFLDTGFSGEKLAVAHNSLINRVLVTPREKDERVKQQPGKNASANGILFIGRLRRESRIDRLLRVIDRIRREDGFDLTLHIIGEGEESAMLKAQARGSSWAVFHGGIYDAARIREISLDCFAGCYPGNAGLSVVHMMSLSLPVITHDNWRQHGPEPSFIRDGVSGWLFDHTDPDSSLYRAIRALASDPAKVAEMRRHAFADYQALAYPSLAERIWAIIGGEPNHEAVPQLADAGDPAAAPASRLAT